MRPALATLVMLLALAITVFAAWSVGADAQQPTLTDAVDIRESYVLGTTFTVPQSGIAYGDKTYPATALLRFPDGYAFAGAQVVLDRSGRYTLEYRATTDDGILSVRKEFDVSERLYSVTGKNSTAEYGTVANAPDRAGIVAQLASGERLAFNNVIDLNGKTKDDTIAQVFVDPAKQGLADALHLIFVLTDLYDSENYITVVNKRLDRVPLSAAWVERSTYTTAAAVGQPATGLELHAEGTFQWEGGKYKLHQNDLYGAGVLFSMSGIPNFQNENNLGAATDVAGQSLTLSIDYEQARVYMNGGIVADLDDVTMFKSVQWNGFKTGECLLSIYAAEYNQDKFRLVCTQVDDLPQQALQTGLVTDDDAPVLTVDYGDYTDGFPDAIVGKAYPVPKVTAYDKTDKDVPVTVRAYANYGTKAQINVDVANGAFVPTRAGKYTVVYTASDRFGKSAQLRYDVTAVVDDAQLSIELGEHATETAAGQETTVAVPKVVHAHGIPDVGIAAKLEAENIEIEISDTYTFRPMHAGAWQIEYTYSDYMETKTESYTLTVKPSDTPYIAADVTLPDYYIRGATYDVPQLTAIAFDTGKPVETETAVYIREDGGEERQLTSARFTPYAEREIAFSFRLGSGEHSVEKTYTRPVVDVGYDKLHLRIKDYFVGEHFTTEATGDRIAVVTQAPGTQSFVFVNALQMFDFRAVFHVSAAANKFDTINVYLTDCVDKSVVVKVSYRRFKAGNTVFTVNDGAQEYVSTGDFVESSADNFRLLYDNATRKIAPSNEFGIAVTHDLSGKPFVGFSGDRAYMRVELANVEGRAGVEFLSINNQPMSRVSFDLLRPEISANPVRGEKYIGDEIEIAPTYAADVLDPDLRFTMQVRTPDGEYVTAKDGTTLDKRADPTKGYAFTVTQYGTYTVLYECADAAGNRTLYSYVINVVDTEPPTVTLSEHATTASVGDTVIVAAADMQDNLTACTLQIKVKWPNGSFAALHGNSFKATIAGKYTVYYYAYDEAGNVTSVSYDVDVR